MHGVQQHRFYLRQVSPASALDSVGVSEGSCRLPRRGVVDLRLAGSGKEFNDVQRPLHQGNIFFA